MLRIIHNECIYIYSVIQVYFKNVLIYSRTIILQKDRIKKMLNPAFEMITLHCRIPYICENGNVFLI